MNPRRRRCNRIARKRRHRGVLVVGMDVGHGEGTTVVVVGNGDVFTFGRDRIVRGPDGAIVGQVASLDPFTILPLEGEGS